MRLRELVDRLGDARRWESATKLPWHDPAFSERMLAEHLSQAHNAASRRFDVIDRHVRWIHDELLGGRASRVLDLACGPGLYTQRLAALGHACHGIDFAPAAIEYARASAARMSHAPRYTLGDVREAEFGGPFDLAMMLFGELNVFTGEDAAAVIRKAGRAIAAGGQLLLEVHDLGAVRSIGVRPRQWMAVAGGLFSDRPHLRLDENHWDAETQQAVALNWIIDVETGAVTAFGTRTQGYSDTEYDQLLSASGLERALTLAEMPGSPEPSDTMVIVAVPRP
jgi:SAM-dependent methyltransferase